MYAILNTRMERTIDVLLVVISFVLMSPNPNEPFECDYFRSTSIRSISFFLFSFLSKTKSFGGCLNGKPIIFIFLPRQYIKLV